MTLLAAGVDGLEAAGGIRIDVRFVAVDLEFVLQEDPPPSLMLVVLLRVDSALFIVSTLVRRVIESVERRLSVRASLKGWVSVVNEGSVLMLGPADALELRRKNYMSHKIETPRSLCVSYLEKLCILS